MNTYIWHHTDPVSDRYHSGGGLLVVAEDLDQARRLAATGLADALDRHYRNQREYEAKGIAMDWETWQDTAPDVVYPCEHSTTVMAFPNAGCC